MKLNWNLLWQIPIVLAVIAILYVALGYMALDYIADRQCIKYGARGYVIYPKMFCTAIVDGTEIYLLPETLDKANPGHKDPMRTY